MFWGLKVKDFGYVSKNLRLTTPFWLILTISRLTLSPKLHLASARGVFDFLFTRLDLC